MKQKNENLLKLNVLQQKKFELKQNRLRPLNYWQLQLKLESPAAREQKIHSALAIPIQLPTSAWLKARLESREVGNLANPRFGVC